MKKLAILLGLFFFFFTGFIAFLQSPWAKEQMRLFLAEALQHAGLDVQIEKVEGTFPQTITLQGIEVRKADLTLSVETVKAQVSLLRLIKKELAFNSIQAEGITWKEILKEKKEEKLGPSLEKGTSFPIYIQHFVLRRVQIPGSFLCEGQGHLWIGPKETLLEAHLQRVDFPESHADVHLKISSSKTLKGQIIIETPTLQAITPLESLDGALSLKLSAKGPLEALWDRSLPLQGKLQGSFTPTTLSLPDPLSPLLKRTWSFSSRFQQQKDRSLFFSQLFAKSDLLTIKGDGALTEQGAVRQALFEMQSKNLWEESHLAVQGHLFASLHLQQTKQGLQSSLFWNIPSLQHDSWSASQLQGSAEAIWNGKTWQGQIKAKGLLEKDLWEAASTITRTAEGAWIFQDSRLQAPHVDLQSERFEILPNASLRGTSQIAVTNLHALRFLFPKAPLYGSFSAKAIFDWEEMDPVQKMALEAKAMDVYYGSFFAEQISLYADLTSPFTERSGSASLGIQKSRWKELRFEEISLETASNALNWSFQFQTIGQVKHPLNLKGEGFWKYADKEFLATLQSASGSFFNHPLSLSFPVTVEISPSVWRCHDLQIEIADTQLFASLQHLPEQTDLSIKCERLPLDFLSLNPLDVSVDGLLSLEAELHESQKALKGTLTAFITGMEVSSLGEVDKLRANGAFQGFLDKGRLEWKGGLDVRDQPLLALNLSLPVQASLWPLQGFFLYDQEATGQLHFHGKVEDILDFFDLGTHHLQGICQCDLQFKNTLAHPTLEGTCTFEEGLYQNYYTGTDLQDLKARFLAKGSKIFLESFTAQDSQNKGDFQATGELWVNEKKDFPFTLDASFSRFSCVQIDLVNAEAEGNLHIEGNRQSALATGNVSILKSELTIPDKLPSSLPELKVVYRNASQPVQTPSSALYKPYPLHLDLHVSAPKGVFIVGRGLQSEWKGEFDIGGTFTELTAKGKLELISGEFVFSSRQFKLNHGALSLSGKEHEMPYLDIAGTIDQKGITITAHLKGPLNQPQLTFQSSPPLPLSSILSHLLFGQDLSEISGFQALQLATSIASLAGEGADVMENTRRSLGVDRLQIVSAPGSEDGDDTVALQVGKYVAKGVIVTYTQGAEDSSGNISIEVEIKDNFVFQAETQQTPEQQGKFTLKWTLNY